MTGDLPDISESDGWHYSVIKVLRDLHVGTVGAFDLSYCYTAQSRSDALLKSYNIIGEKHISRL